MTKNLISQVQSESKKRMPEKKFIRVIFFLFIPDFCCTFVTAFQEEIG